MATGGRSTGMLAALLKMEAALTVTGDADVALAWERYRRPELWSTWSPQIVRVDCSDEVIVAGSTGTVHALLGVSVPFVVTEMDEPQRRWSWSVVLPLGIGLHLRHVVRTATSGKGTSGRGCTTGLRVIGPAPIVLGYLPVAGLALGRLVHP